MKRFTSEDYDYLIVGAGFAGAVLAERLAAGLDKRVLLIDRREHIAGNAYDYYNDDGILVHRYGPHIFHTNASRIVEYLSRFTEWRSYEHRVLAQVDDQLLPMPINLTTLNKLYRVKLTEKEAQDFLAVQAEPIEKVKSAADLIISKIGRDLYEKFFRGYTLKQWGLDPADLDKSVTARVPTRTNYDDRYFDDSFQYMPLEGYSKMFEKMLAHPNISLRLSTDFKSLNKQITYRSLIYSGPIDEYFAYCYGKLPYRSLKFVHKTFDIPQYQPAAVINYPSEHIAHTRITEYKYLTGQTHPKTSLSWEYPTSEGEPYYPIPRSENQNLYRKYQDLADKLANVTFVGRLGSYRYYNMDQVVAQALSIYSRISKYELEGAINE